MPAQIFACVSHKGGTGRSTTVANVAFELACRGQKVCLVDLDLSSPTLGAVLQMDGKERGVKKDKGVHQYLPSRDRPLQDIKPLNQKHLLNVGSDEEGSSNAYVREAIRDGGGSLQVLLGEENPGGDASEEVLQEPLRALIVSLKDLNFDYIFLDVRSGRDSPLNALARLSNTSAISMRWIIFFRWTPQHIVGADDVIAILAEHTGTDKGNQDDVRRLMMGVRVAYQDEVTRKFMAQLARPDSSDERQDEVRQLRDWLEAEEKRLERLFSRTSLVTMDIIDIPLSEVLLLRDGIISGRERTLGAAAKHLREYFEKVADRLQSW